MGAIKVTRRESSNPKREVPVTIIYVGGLQYRDSKKIIESLDDGKGDDYEGYRINSLGWKGKRGLYEGEYFHTDMQAEIPTLIRGAENGIVLDNDGESSSHFITAIKRKLAGRKILYGSFKTEVSQGKVFGSRVPDLENVIDEILRKSPCRSISGSLFASAIQFSFCYPIS